MTDLYTSYETSLALRGAGADQSGAKYWMRPDEGSQPYLARYMAGVPKEARAWRSDEIIEALVATDSIESIWPPKPPLNEWCVQIRFDALGLHGDAIYEKSFVEALAAAWLAVLEGARHAD